MQHQEHDLATITRQIIVCNNALSNLSEVIRTGVLSLSTLQLMHILVIVLMGT